MVVDTGARSIPGGGVATISDAIERTEERLFVGRDRELATFRRWREATDQPSVLNVAGPPGVGKSSLLRAFVRQTRAAGGTVVSVDGASIRDSSEALLASLGGTSVDEVADRLNTAHPLVVIDTFGEIADQSAVLQGILERLDTSVRVVVAARVPLVTLWEPRWSPIVHTLVLDGLSDEAARAYLALRGLDDPRHADEILAVSGRLPLAVALAADMVTRLGVSRLDEAPQWHLALHTLVNQLLGDVEDPGLRELIESAALVRRFDEELLQEIAGRPDLGHGFTRLSRLAVVKPVSGGLTLHADSRRLIAEDLRWRRPERFQQLRARALEAYRRRFERASQSERERLVADRMYLWEHRLVHSMLFAKDDAETPRVDAGRPEDHEPIMEAWFRWLEAIPTPQAPAPNEVEQERRWLRDYLRHEGLCLRVFRDGQGRMTGYLTTMPVYAGSVELLCSHPYRGRVVDAYLGARHSRSLPTDPADADITYLFQMGTTDPDDAGTRAATLREAVGNFARSGVFLATPVAAEYRELTAALGFRPVPGSTSSFRGLTIEGVALDVGAIGFERWLGAITQGKRPPTPLSPGEFEAELQRVLTDWNGDATLAASPLATLTESASDASLKLVAGSLRQVVLAGLDHARSGLEGDDLLPYRAIELAYIKRSVSHDRVAERLNVSRSTFYRLLRRGVQGLAVTLRGG